MAQTGYTPISLYYSTTASQAPTAGNLANGELAINITDGKLYYKDNTGAVKVIAGTGGTGVVAGSNTQIQFNNNGVFGASANLTWDGSFLTVASIKDSALTSGRVTYAGASGLLTDSANLTFNGTTLTAGGLTTTGTTSTGVLSVTGNTTLGDASADTVTVNGTITSNLLFTDNTYDIGASGATRPRAGYFATDLQVPTAYIPNGMRVFDGGDTGAANNYWWKIGTWVPGGGYSNEIEITVYGSNTFSAGLANTAKATILLRVDNSGAIVGAWYSQGQQGTTSIQGVAVKSSTGEVWVKYGNYFQLQINPVYCSSDTWTTAFSSTGSGTTPTGATEIGYVWQISDGLITWDAGNRCVSIGTSTINTARKLYVYGGDALIERAGANAAVGIYSNGGSGVAYYMVSDTGGNWQLYDQASLANRITVNSNGNIGLLTAPKVWQGGISVLQLGAQASLSYGGGTNMVLGNNRYFNSGDKFIASGNYATILEMSDGLISFGNSSASGTANAAITWNYGFQINRSGQVVLPGGTTSVPTATAGYVLDVRGNILAYKASGNTSIVASTGTNANAAMNAYENFGVEFNTDGSYTSYAWAQGATRKMWLVANDSGNSSLGIAVSNPQSYAANGVRCSIVTNQPIISNDTVFSRIQSRGYVMQDTGSGTVWTKFGTFYTSNNGYMCRIRYSGHVGFNANPAQLGMCEILFSTSNGSSSQAGSTGNFYGMFVAYRLGPANVVITVRVVQINTDTYEIWGYIPNYSNGGYYEVSFSDGQAWTHSGSVGTPSGNYVDVNPSVITYT